MVKCFPHVYNPLNVAKNNRGNLGEIMQSISWKTKDIKRSKQIIKNLKKRRKTKTLERQR